MAHSSPLMQHTHTQAHARLLMIFFRLLLLLLLYCFEFRRTTAFITVEAIFFSRLWYLCLRCDKLPFILSIYLSPTLCLSSVFFSFIRSFGRSFFQSVWCFNMNIVYTCMCATPFSRWLADWLNVYFFS